MKNLAKPLCFAILGISILFSSCAKDGIDGIDGSDGRDGVDGVDGQNGVDGMDGQDGQDLTSIDQLNIVKIGSFEHGAGEPFAEISAFYPLTNKLFIVILKKGKYLFWI